jgi:excisionase family DNA binding protein
MNAAQTLTERLRMTRGTLTVKQAAAELGEHFITTYRRVEAGHMPHMRIGSRIKIDPVALAAWVEQRTV